MCNVACTVVPSSSETLDPPHHGRNWGYSSPRSTRLNICSALCGTSTVFSTNAIPIRLLRDNFVDCATRPLAVLHCTVSSLPACRLGLALNANRNQGQTSCRSQAAFPKAGRIDEPTAKYTRNEHRTEQKSLSRLLH